VVRIGRNITRTQNYYCSIVILCTDITRIYTMYTHYGARVAVRFVSGAAMRVRARRGRARAHGQRDFGTRPGGDGGGGPHVEHMVSHGGRVPFVACMILLYYFFIPYRHKHIIYIYIVMMILLYEPYVLRGLRSYIIIYYICRTLTFTYNMCNSHGEDLHHRRPDSLVPKLLQETGRVYY